MQFAIIDGKPIQAGPDAPRLARCLYCDEQVWLTIPVRQFGAYAWMHIRDKDADQCQQRDHERVRNEYMKGLGVE